MNYTDPLTYWLIIEQTSDGPMLRGRVQSTSAYGYKASGLDGVLETAELTYRARGNRVLVVTSFWSRELRTRIEGLRYSVEDGELLGWHTDDGAPHLVRRLEDV